MGDAKELPSLSNLISQFPSIAFQPLKLPPLRFMLALTKPIANAFELLISKPSFLHNSYIRTITLHLEEKGSSLKFHPFLLPSLKASKEKQMMVKTRRSSLAKTQAPSSQRLSHETVKISNLPCKCLSKSCDINCVVLKWSSTSIVETLNMQFTMSFRNQL
jgi:hypothetical protein